jgi:hypothetical protein
LTKITNMYMETNDSTEKNHANTFYN